MGRKIKFCLVYRDMWQSSGKYQPRVDQLKEIAPVIALTEWKPTVALLSR